MTSSSGAAAPIAALVGSSPTPTVATPMRMMVSIMAGRRPYLSPMCPTTTPPSGRATKPTAKVANAIMAAAEDTASEKKSGAMTSPAAAP